MEGDSGGGSILMSNPDTANQADQSTFYLGNTGTAASQNEALAARVDGLEAKVDGVTTEMRAMGSNFAALTEMLRTALAPGPQPAAIAPASTPLPPLSTVSPVTASPEQSGAELSLQTPFDAPKSAAWDIPAPILRNRWAPF